MLTVTAGSKNSCSSDLQSATGGKRRLGVYQRYRDNVIIAVWYIRMITNRIKIVTLSQSSLNRWQPTAKDHPLPGSFLADLACMLATGSIYRKNRCDVVVETGAD